MTGWRRGGDTPRDHRERSSRAGRRPIHTGPGHWVLASSLGVPPNVSTRSLHGHCQGDEPWRRPSGPVSCSWNHGKEPLWEGTRCLQSLCSLPSLCFSVRSDARGFLPAVASKWLAAGSPEERGGALGTCAICCLCHCRRVSAGWQNGGPRLCHLAGPVSASPHRPCPWPVLQVRAGGHWARVQNACPRLCPVAD